MMSMKAMKQSKETNLHHKSSSSADSEPVTEEHYIYSQPKKVSRIIGPKNSFTLSQITLIIILPLLDSIRRLVFPKDREPML